MRFPCKSSALIIRRASARLEHDRDKSLKVKCFHRLHSTHGFLVPSVIHQIAIGTEQVRDLQIKGRTWFGHAPMHFFPLYGDNINNHERCWSKGGWFFILEVCRPTCSRTLPVKGSKLKVEVGYRAWITTQRQSQCTLQAVGTFLLWLFGWDWKSFAALPR